MLSVNQLFIYPVKSLGGISVSTAMVTDIGFQYDRNWMLVDENLRFLTQREFPLMALLQTGLSEEGIRVFHKEEKGYYVVIPFTPQSAQIVSVNIFDETCEAVFVSNEVDEWFSEMLSHRCRLVYMPAELKRFVDKDYAKNNEATSFSDGYPFLMIGQASIEDLNKRLLEKLPVNRFRPNIVFEGGAPYEEDDLTHFAINRI